MEETKILNFDTGYSWIIMLACMCNLGILDGIASSFGVLLVDLSDYFGSDKASVSLIGSAFYGVYCLMGPIAGALSNKYGCRIVCMIGAVTASVGLLLSSFSKSLIMLTITYGIIGGIGSGFICLPSIVCVSFFFQKRRALAVGIALCGAGIGTSTVPPFVAYLIEKYGWQNSVLLQSGIMLNVLIFSALLRPNEPQTVEIKQLDMEEKQIATQKYKKKTRNNSYNGTEECKDKHVNKPFLSQKLFTDTSSLTKKSCNQNPLYQKDIFYSRSVCKLNKSLASLEPTVLFNSMTVIPQNDNQSKIKTSFLSKQLKDAWELMTNLDIVKNPSYIVAWIVNMTTMVAFRIPVSFVPDFASDLGIDEIDAGWLNTAYGVCNIVGRVGFGWLGGLTFTSVHMIILVTLSICGVIIGIYPLCYNYVTLIIPYSMMGFFLAACASLTTEFLCELAGLENLTNAYGLVVFAHGVGSFIGAPLAGSLYSEKIGYTLPFLFGSALFIVSSGLYLILYIPYFQKYFVKNNQTNDKSSTGTTDRL